LCTVFRVWIAFGEAIIAQESTVVVQTDSQLIASVKEDMAAYLPIRIESVIPHDIAGTEAPLYSALGP
jgi:hypothetical protein